MDAINSLGYFNPLFGIDQKRVTTDAVVRELENRFRSHLASKGLTMRSFICRWPEKDAQFKKAACEEHQDNDHKGNWFVVWATRTPTIIREKTSNERFYPKTYQLVLVDDNRCVHHKPIDFQPRWFVRCGVDLQYVSPSR